MGDAEESSTAGNRSQAGFSQDLSSGRRCQRADRALRVQGTFGPRRSVDPLICAKGEQRRICAEFAQPEKGLHSNELPRSRAFESRVFGGRFARIAHWPAQCSIVQSVRVTGISPCFGEGSGLKQVTLEMIGPEVLISPCFGEGSGLKQRSERRRGRADADLPLLRRGERIETCTI